MAIIKDLWVSYLESVVPKNACENQVIETKRAFYAGASCMFAQVVDFSTNNKHSSEENVKFFSGIDEEIKTWMEGIEKDIE